MMGRPCRSPVSKSLGSWPGVIFSAPVPNSMETASSSMSGMGLFKMGSSTRCPLNLAYRLSLGFTATAVSPSSVSGLVVATVT